MNDRHAECILGDLEFPSEWIVFAPLVDDFCAKKPDEWEHLSDEILQRIPNEITWGGRVLPAQRITARRGQFDLRTLFVAQDESDPRQQAAYVFVPLESAAGGPVTLGLDGDTWIQAWLNGEAIMQTGGGDRRWPPRIDQGRVTVTLHPGTNVLVVRLLGGHRNVMTGSAVLAMGGPRELCAGDFRSILNDPIECDPCWMRTEPHAPLGDKPAVEIGSRRELFVDDFILDGLAGSACRQLCHPTPREVVFRAERPWEGVSSGIYAAVEQDSGQFLLYYRANPEQVSDDSAAQYACVAQSADGIGFERPELGLIEFDGSRRNNIIWEGVSAHNFTPFRDANPDAPADERFKAVAFHPNGKSLGAFVSPDGLHWRMLTEEPIITRGTFDSQNTAFWDAQYERYVCYSRDNSTGVRRIMRSTSPDFLTWTEPEPLQFADTRREHMYTNGIRPYFRAPHIYLGFPARFVQNRHKVAAHPHYGISDAILMAGRDGLCFERWAEGFVRPDAEPEVWTDRNNYPAWGLIQTSPSELSLYWSEHYRHPGNRLRRGTLRTDGFVALHGGAEEIGEALTRPFVFVGDRLVVNYATSAIGSIRFALCGEDGASLPGFDLIDSEVLFGNEIDHAVAWHGGAQPGSLAGRPVRLRIRLQDARLYAFWFTDDA